MIVKLDLYKNVTIYPGNAPNHKEIHIQIDSIADPVVADFFEELMRARDLVYVEDKTYLVTATRIESGKIIAYGEEKIW